MNTKHEKHDKLIEFAVGYFLIVATTTILVMLGIILYAIFTGHYQDMFYTN